MIKGATRARTYRAIYRLLDRVSPVPFDCGTICGSVCCTVIDKEDMGIYLLPGEEKIHDRHADWLTWNTQSTEEFDFPESWHGKVIWIRCNEPPHCPRRMRPIQCRTFPLAPHLTEEGELRMIYNDSDLPYICPMIEDETELDPDFIQATYTVWKHLIRDPLIYDLVRKDSEERRTEMQDIDHPEFVSEKEICTLFPERPKECHKGSFGYVALIGGSLEYSGAIRLAAIANSSMRSGAGVASVAAPRSICPLIAPRIMEATLYPLSDRDGELVFDEEEFSNLCRRYDVIAFGMGIGNSGETLKAIEYLLTHYDKTLIVDADGLNAMARLDHSIIRSSKARLVLTPHAKEFSRLSGMTVEDAKADPAQAAAYLADELDAVVLLKGSTTVVAGPGEQGRILATDRGCPGMATAGSGDVLSGILAALCVNADDLVLAAAAGAYINGAAGEAAQNRRSDVTMTSADTAGCVAEVIEKIIRQR